MNKRFKLKDYNTVSIYLIRDVIKTMSKQTPKEFFTALEVSAALLKQEKIRCTKQNLYDMNYIVASRLSFMYRHGFFVNRTEEKVYTKVKTAAITIDRKAYGYRYTKTPIVILTEVKGITPSVVVQAMQAMPVAHINQILNKGQAIIEKRC